MTSINSLNASSLSIGNKLPELEIAITPLLIVSGAIATQDFQNVHHDKAAAQAAGTPDIFMNILTTNGLVGRYLTDWAGPTARLQRIQLKLGAPNFPGDTMILSGKISSIAESIVEVEFKGKNGLGNHVTGIASLALDGAAQ
jgi:acyl dehydratase